MNRYTLTHVAASSVVADRFDSDHKPMTIEFPVAASPAAASASAADFPTGPSAHPLPRLHWEWARQEEYAGLAGQLKGLRPSLRECHASIRRGQLQHAIQQLGDVIQQAAISAGCRHVPTSKRPKGKVRDSPYCDDECRRRGPNPVMQDFRVIPKKVVPRVPSGYGAVGLAIAWYLPVVRVSTLSWGMRGSCLYHALAAPGCVPIFFSVMQLGMIPPMYASWRASFHTQFVESVDSNASSRPLVFFVICAMTTNVSGPNSTASKQRLHMPCRHVLLGGVFIRNSVPLQQFHWHQTTK